MQLTKEDVIRGIDTPDKVIRVSKLQQVIKYYDEQRIHLDDWNSNLFYHCFMEGLE